MRGHLGVQWLGVRKKCCEAFCSRAVVALFCVVLLSSFPKDPIDELLTTLHIRSQYMKHHAESSDGDDDRDALKVAHPVCLLFAAAMEDPNSSTQQEAKLGTKRSSSKDLDVDVAAFNRENVSLDIRVNLPGTHVDDTLPSEVLISSNDKERLVPILDASSISAEPCPSLTLTLKGDPQDQWADIKQIALYMSQSVTCYQRGDSKKSSMGRTFQVSEGGDDEVGLSEYQLSDYCSLMKYRRRLFPSLPSPSLYKVSADRRSLEIVLTLIEGFDIKRTELWAFELDPNRMLLHPVAEAREKIRGHLIVKTEIGGLQETARRAVWATNVISAASVFLSGTPQLLLPQQALVLTMSFCSKASERVLVSNASHILAPFTISAFQSDMEMLGPLVVNMILLFVVCVTTLVAFTMRHYHNTAEVLLSEKNTEKEATSRFSFYCIATFLEKSIRWPHHVAFMWLVLQPGLLFFSSRNVYWVFWEQKDEEENAVVQAIGIPCLIFFGFFIPFVPLYWHRQNKPLGFRMYTSEPTLVPSIEGGGTAVGVRASTPTPNTTSWKHHALKFVQAFFYHKGAWGPTHIFLSFGTYVRPLMPATYFMWMSSSTLIRVLVSIPCGIETRNPEKCRVIHVYLATILSAYALFTLTTRPYRSPAFNILQCVVYALIALYNVLRSSFLEQQAMHLLIVCMCVNTIVTVVLAVADLHESYVRRVHLWKEGIPQRLSARKMSSSYRRMQRSFMDNTAAVQSELPFHMDFEGVRYEEGSSDSIISDSDDEMQSIGSEHFERDGGALAISERTTTPTYLRQLSSARLSSLRGLRDRRQSSLKTNKSRSHNRVAFAENTFPSFSEQCPNSRGDAFIRNAPKPMLDLVDDLRDSLLMANSSEAQQEAESLCVSRGIRQCNHVPSPEPVPPGYDSNQVAPPSYPDSTNEPKWPCAPFQRGPLTSRDLDPLHFSESLVFDSDPFEWFHTQVSN